MEDRNFAHAGCLVGLILGLGSGIALAWNLILHGFMPATALFLWGIITVALGGIGYVIGSRFLMKPRSREE